MFDRPRPANAPMAFLSDVHGNLLALDAVLDELQRRMVDSIYVAGDLLLGGDAPAEVYKRLQQVDARCVRGVSDSALVEIGPDSLEPLDKAQTEMARRFRSTRSAVGELALKYLERLPEKLRIPMIDGTEILMVHGSPSDPTTEISHDLEEDEILALIDGDPADIIVCGASHVPFSRLIDDVRVVNVGSVGQAPEGGLAHYTIITPRMDGTLIEQTWVSYGEA